MLARAASPVFAGMSLLTTLTPPSLPLCGDGTLSAHSMALMYLLMAVFSLPAWSKVT